MIRFATVLMVIEGLLLFAATSAEAGPYVTPGPTKFAAPKWGLPTPDEVPSKEYSNDVDKGGHDRFLAVGLPHDSDPEQVIAWDGSGGTMDALLNHGFPAGGSIDYSGTRIGDSEDRQVDAIANKRDVLFNDVKSDSSYLLFSVSNPLGKSGGDHIFYETPMPLTFPVGLGGPKAVADGGIWAAPAAIESDAAELNDVDGLEVWGDGTDQPIADTTNLPGGGVDAFNDSNRYSLEGDPDVDGAAGEPRVSVWNARLLANIATPYILQSTIVDAIASLAINGDLDSDEKALVDVDALMVFDEQGDRFFGPLDQILFSIAPIPGEFDGGEIFHMIGPTAKFLFHGDHLWDQAFDVSGLVAGFLGINPNDVSENINALEAVSFELDEPPPGDAAPEPTAAILAALGLLCLGMTRRRRR